MSGTTYQLTNFHFNVNFDFDSDGNSVDVRFQSVAGLEALIETEPLKEGGENHFTHVLPVRRKFGPLVLKRGLLLPDGQSKLTAALKTAFEEEVFTPFKLVTINLLNENHKTMVHWRVDNAWPLSWKISELNAMEGAVLIETLELNYNHLIYST
jgi:phage tail-like protein